MIILTKKKVITVVIIAFVLGLFIGYWTMKLTQPPPKPCPVKYKPTYHWQQQLLEV